MSERAAVAPEEFLRRDPDNTEAVIVRIGAGSAQLVLVDGQGRWDRWVYHDVDACREVAERIGVTSVHVGSYPEQIRLRMNSRRRPAEDFERAPYPEAGWVGPFIPYPENRPRPPHPLPEEEPPRRGGQGDARP